MRKIITTLVTLGLFVGALTGTAEARDARPTPAQIKRVCETSGRGDAAYDRYCMRYGTAADGIRLWFSIPRGRMAREGEFNRVSLCRYAGQYGGVRPMAREVLFDMAYDRFHNHTQVLRVAGTVAVWECGRLNRR